MERPATGGDRSVDPIKEASETVTSKTEQIDGWEHSRSGLRYSKLMGEKAESSEYEQVAEVPEFAKVALEHFTRSQDQISTE